MRKTNLSKHLKKSIDSNVLATVLICRRRCKGHDKGDKTICHLAHLKKIVICWALAEKSTWPLSLWALTGPNRFQMYCKPAYLLEEVSEGTIKAKEIGVDWKISEKINVEKFNVPPNTGNTLYNTSKAVHRKKRSRCGDYSHWKFLLLCICIYHI